MIQENISVDSTVYGVSISSHCLYGNKVSGKMICALHCTEKLFHMYNVVKYTNH